MKQFFWILCFLIFPTISHAEVLLSEVAWMGTDKPDTGSYCEWIELHNTDSTEIDISGWVLSFGSANIIFESGTQISADGYFVIERYTENACPDPVVGVSDYSKSFGSSGLSNSGTTITLTRSGESNFHDSVDGTNEWKIDGNTQVGNNETKETAQWTGSKWITGTPTPGAANVSVGTVNEEETEEIVDTAPTTNVTQRTKTSGGGGRAVPKKPVATAEPALSVQIAAPHIAYVNQRVEFLAEPSGIGKTLMNSLAYTWNFGDTYTGEGKKQTHIFVYPGEYIVVAYATVAKQKIITRHEVTVLPVQLAVSRTEEGDLVLKNNSKQEVDLEGFTLTGDTHFVFPKFSFLKPGGKVTIAASRVGALNGRSVILADALGTQIVREGSEVLTNESRTILAKSVPLQNTSPRIEETVSLEVTEKEGLTTGSETQAYIPIGKLASQDGSSAQGVFKKFFTRVVGFFGL